MIDFKKYPLVWEWSTENGLPMLSAKTSYLEEHDEEEDLDEGDLPDLSDPVYEVCLLEEIYHFNSIPRNFSRKEIEDFLFKDAKIKLELLDKKLEEDLNPPNHLGCPSYPMCDENELGCLVIMGDDVEWYGHRD